MLVRSNLGRLVYCNEKVLLKTKNLLFSLPTLASTTQATEEKDPLQQELGRLTALLNRLSHGGNYFEKITILDELPEVQDLLSKPSPIRTFLADLSEDYEYLVKAVFAIKQGTHLFDVPLTIPDPILCYRRLLDEVLEIDQFYKDSGGIIGYQCLALSFLTKPEKQDIKTTFLPPEGTDLSDENHPTVKWAILEGVRQQKEMAEIYPVGGAADRLQLKDEATGKKLPAACLIFQGKHLLEGVIRDLQAREYLYYQLFGEQIATPLALMTSKVNHNHDHIREICKKNGWFGRLEENFKFFTQPSIPVFNNKGDWCLQQPLKLLLRPGGHGVIWKLAIETGVFDWLGALGRKKALIRQINNPMAAVDYGLAAFLGIGHAGNKVFGFASCERRVNAHEGMNVLKIIEKPEGKLAILTNVEYCDFKKFGIEDKPKNLGNPHSLFPSNTNILFVDIKAVRKAVEKLPFPGLLVNFREGTHYHPNKGTRKEKIARLETAMQNIADAFDVPFGDNLPSYVTYNERRKTISTTKQKTTANNQLLETPEGCFYDFMQNAQELLSQYCSVKFTSVNNKSVFMEKVPPFLLHYHPALGPFYSIIKQKIYGGEILSGSEIQLEIADLDMKDFFLDGSLLIFAEAVMGHTDKEGRLVYSPQTGQCILKNVRIENKGIDWNDENHIFWKHDIKRRESLTIHLHGNSRFEAENVMFKGNQNIEVPEGSHMIVTQKGEDLHFKVRSIDSNKPFWTYQIAIDNSILLSS